MFMFTMFLKQFFMNYTWDFKKNFYTTHLTIIDLMENVLNWWLMSNQSCSSQNLFYILFRTIFKSIRKFFLILMFRSRLLSFRVDSTQSHRKSDFLWFLEPTHGLFEPTRLRNRTLVFLRFFESTPWISRVDPWMLGVDTYFSWVDPLNFLIISIFDFTTSSRLHQSSSQLHENWA